jgi:transposase
MKEEEAIKRKFEMLEGDLNERTRRLTAASEAMALGWGGISAVVRATGISQRTIRQGIQELKAGNKLEQGRIRRVGGGRKKTMNKDESLSEDLERLMKPVTGGDLESQLRWTCKSVRQLATELQDLGHQVSYPIVSELLHDLGYSLQAYRRMREGEDYSPRDNRFENLNVLANQYVSEGKPVISIDIKKTEMLDDDTNSGPPWRLPAKAEEVSIKDFLGAGSTFVTPYSVFDPAHNRGWKNIGLDHVTVAFAAEGLRRWWNVVGKSKYRRARQMLISTNSGKSSGSHTSLWNWELQGLADETRLKINFCPLPSGTSKWNNIKNPVFAWINQNVRDKSIINYLIIIKEIAATTLETELIVHCQLDTNTYPQGRRISDEEMASIRLIPSFSYYQWFYYIFPHDR